MNEVDNINGTKEPTVILATAIKWSVVNKLNGRRGRWVSGRDQNNSRPWRIPLGLYREKRPVWHLGRRGSRPYILAASRSSIFRWSPVAHSSFKSFYAQAGVHSIVDGLLISPYLRFKWVGRCRRLYQTYEDGVNITFIHWCSGCHNDTNGIASSQRDNRYFRRCKHLVELACMDDTFISHGRDDLKRNV